MAESYIDPNLLAWQKANVSQSLEGFQQHTADLKARREAYEQQKKEREQLIATAEGLGEHFATQGETAPAYIHKFLNKAKTSGGIQQMATTDIVKFLGMHSAVSKQQDIDLGVAGKRSEIALREAQTNQAKASTKSTTGEEVRKQSEFDKAEALRNFLAETSMETVAPQKRTTEKPTGVGVKNLTFKDPRTGEVRPIDESSYSEMGLDENGKVVDKDVFTYVSSLPADELATIIGHPVEPSAEANINNEINASRERWKQVLGMEPEAIFDKGGSRKSIRGEGGKVTFEKSPAENMQELIRVINHNPRLFPNGVPREYKGRDITSGYSWSGRNKAGLTSSQMDALQDYVIDRLESVGYEDLATVGKIIKGHREIQKQSEGNALQFEKKILTEQVEETIDNEAVLASVRYDQVAARWKEKGLPPPLPKAAYIAASVPEVTRVIPQVDEYGRPTGAVKTFVKIGDTWKDVTAEKSMPSPVDAWKITEAQGKDNMLNFNGQYGSIIINGRATAFDDKGVTDLTESLNNMDAFNEYMDMLKELYTKHNFIERINPASSARAQIKGLIRRAQPLIRKIILGSGVVTEPDQSRLDQLFRDPDAFETWFNDDANIAEFDAVKGVLEQKAIALLNTHKVVQPDGKRGWMTSGKSDKGKAKALELLAVHQQGYRLTDADKAVIKKYNPDFGR